MSWGPGRRRRATPARASPKPSSGSRVFLWLLAKLIYDVLDVQKSESVIHVYSFSDSFPVSFIRRY